MVTPIGNSPGPGAQRVAHRDVAGAHRVVDRAHARPVGDRRRVVAEEVAHEADDVGLVDGAGHADDVADRVRDARRVVADPPGHVGVLEAAGRGDPARQREVVQGHDRREAPLAAALGHGAVARQRALVDAPALGLDARPLHREAVGVEPEARDQVEVLRPAVPRVAGGPARLGDGGARRALEVGPVGLPAALDLVARGGGAPQEHVEGARRHPRTLLSARRRSRSAPRPRSESD